VLDEGKDTKKSSQTVTNVAAAMCVFISFPSGNLIQYLSLFAAINPQLFHHVRG